MIEPFLTLRASNAAEPGPDQVGRDRMRLLAAVGREGSIAGGARAVGLTYKAAWDGLEAMARLFGRPLLDRRVGGAAGGGARLTPAGEHVLATFARLEAELRAAARLFDGPSAAAPPPGEAAVLRTSARNMLRGEVSALRTRGLGAVVTLDLPEGGQVAARVTAASAASLGLAVGRPAIALVKAPFVQLAPAAAGAGPNAFAATVLATERAAGDAEVLLDIGQGRSLHASGRCSRFRHLDLAAGGRVSASFAAADVILAID